MRHLVFRFYPAIAVLALLLGFAIVSAQPSDARGALAGSLVAGVLGFCYFVQQQKLGETLLFKDLFTGFNSRYDRLNGPLARLSPGTSLTREEMDLLVDYLNLCAEEFLFHQQGFILPTVWRSWCRGMLQYLEVAAISDFVQAELAKDDYYGLTLAHIRKGSA